MNKKFIRITKRKNDGHKYKPLQTRLCTCEYCVLNNWLIKL